MDQMTENIMKLKGIALLSEDWDGEDGRAFESSFIEDVIDLISTMSVQPDLSPTGRGSIQFEYGSLRKGQRYLGLEIFNDHTVHSYFRDENGNRMHDKFDMEEVNGRVLQF